MKSDPTRRARPAFRAALPLAALAAGMIAHPLAARLYDAFNSAGNWTLSANSGSATIGSSVLTLTSPASALSNPEADLNTNQVLTGTRQSILVRSHSGILNQTVFFFWAEDPATGNKLELKINDTASPANVSAGYYSGGGATYHFLGSVSYAPGADGLYLAFMESGGTTHWQVSTDGGAGTWSDVASLANPVATGSMAFKVQHKAYATPASATSTVVDCFNYKATGAGYHNISSKTYGFSAAQPDGWHIYREAFNNGLVCQSTDPDTSTCNAGTGCGITVNCVSDHFTDGALSGIRFHMSTDRVSNSAHAGWYMNMYRYQNLPYVDADVWTYHLYFKFGYPQYIHQGLEFPIQKYVGGLRVQGAIAWYPDRPDTLSNTAPHSGTWKVWEGTSKWQSTGHSQTLTPAPLAQGPWNEVTFTVGLHDGNIYYSSFQAGPKGNMTSFSLPTTPFPATSGSGSDRIVPAFQQDDNTADTTDANTAKDVWIANWDIDWNDERLPATP